jgi:hypothetical protein
MQPRRLTDSHCGIGNPYRGFEIMKMRLRCSGSTQWAPSHWRIVNPEAEPSDALMFASGVIAGADTAMASEVFREIALKNA